jgi:hypothetical protein
VCTIFLISIADTWSILFISAARSSIWNIVVQPELSLKWDEQNKNFMTTLNFLFITLIHLTILCYFNSIILSKSLVINTIRIPSFDNQFQWSNFFNASCLDIVGIKCQTTSILIGAVRKCRKFWRLGLFHCLKFWQGGYSKFECSI